MENLRINMYVRLKQGYIGKIININEFREQKYCVDIQASDYVFVESEDIKKSSSHIIVLIEVGDYVNGMEVLHKTNEYIVIVKSKNNDGLFSHELKHITNGNIETIITKENFERDSYNVKN